MIHRTAEINWHEGMFIQPQHFQANDRRLAFQISEQTALNPFWWGVAVMAIDKDALEGYRFNLYSCKLRLRNGTWINIPGNAVMPVKFFQEKMQAHDGALPVWIGVRCPEDHRPRVHQLGEDNIGAVKTSVAREIFIEDENTGDNEQSVQIKLWNIRTFLGEPPGDEYESIKIGEIIRSGQTDLPVMNPAYIPPLLNIGASSEFMEKLKNLSIHLNNQAVFLRREISNQRSALTSDPVKVLDNMLRVQATTGFGLVLEQLQAVDETHPLQVYLELVRLAGYLAPLSPDVSLDIPAYNHNNLTDVMNRLYTIIWSLLDGGSVPDFAERTFEIKEDRRTCRIDQDWLDNELPAYLCVDADVAESDLNATLNDLRVKIGPPSIIDRLMAERKKGMSCQRIRRIPMGLQDRSGLNYYYVDLSRRSPFRQEMSKDLSLEIRGIPANLLSRMKLFIQLKK